MIAPLREPPRSGAGVQNEPLRIARRIVAAALLPRNADTDCAPRVPAWKAWAFAVWLVLTAMAYGLSMLGIKLS